MKNLILVFSMVVLAAICSSGCGTDLRVGGGTKTVHQNATVGQQLYDLQKAKEAGAITEAEFQTQKAKVLAN